jgi:signal transduction histidine kinase
MQDNPRHELDLADRAAAGEVKEALRALTQLNLADGRRHVALIRAARAREFAARAALLRQADRPRALRDLAAVDSWRAAVHQSIDALDSASVAVNNSVRIDDPKVAELVEIRRLAWSIRDNYGFQCSALRANINRGVPPDPALRDNLVGHRAVYAADWRALSEIFERPGLPPDLSRDVLFARRATDLAQKDVDTVVGGLSGANRPAMPGGDWTALCDRPFNAILAIGQQAQTDAYRYADHLRALALRNMLVAILGLGLVLGFGGFCVITLRRRLTRPMRDLTETIARLSRRELDDPVAAGGPDELGSMARVLETLRLSELEALRLQQAMSHFTAYASHQLRTPLSIVGVHLAVLAKRISPDSDAFESLKDIEHAVERLRKLLVKLLVLARVDSGEATPRDGDLIDLGEVVGEVIAQHLPQAVAADVALRFERPEAPIMEKIDTTLFAEILKNLIDNAILYNRPGGHVTVRLIQTPDRSIIEVEDDGPGIPPTELPNVFLRFYRLKRDSRRPGSGLGLAIVQALAASLGAEVQAGPAAGGKGLNVRVSLRPAAPAPPSSSKVRLDGTV